MEEKTPIRLKVAAVLVILFALKGIMDGINAGPAPPSKFYVTCYTPFINSLLKNFQFTSFLGEYISNNFGLWMVLFFLGSIFPYAIYDIVVYNFFAVTRMSLYLGSSTTFYVLIMHGIYELVGMLMVAIASLSLFFLIVQEAYHLIKRKKFYTSYTTEIKMLFISFGALVAAAFIEGYITPLLLR